MGWVIFIAGLFIMTQIINKIRNTALASKPENYKADIIAERRKTTY